MTPAETVMLAALRQIVTDNAGSLETWAHIRAQEAIDRVIPWLDGVPAVIPEVEPFDEW